jgi:hypothetical protein
MEKFENFMQVLKYAIEHKGWLKENNNINGNVKCGVGYIYVVECKTKESIFLLGTISDILFGVDSGFMRCYFGTNLVCKFGPLKVVDSGPNAGYVMGGCGDCQYSSWGNCAIGKIINWQYHQLEILKLINSCKTYEECENKICEYLESHK